jgi:hypothetical protein
MLMVNSIVTHTHTHAYAVIIYCAVDTTSQVLFYRRAEQLNMLKMYKYVGIDTILKCVDYKIKINKIIINKNIYFIPFQSNECY